MGDSSDKLAWDDEHCVDLFAKSLCFETVSALGVSNGSYAAFGAWIAELCTAAGLQNVTILPESVQGKPIVVAEWLGLEPDLPCIFLNSHYDVVPVMHDFWTVPPFQGLRRDGKVYGRGAQDMKCVCVQYLIALQRLRSQGFQPRRTIRLSYVPDEEIGGTDGMGVLLRSRWFQTFKIGLALDEGLASESNTYSVFYGERLPWWIKVTAVGNTGHASRFIDNTAVEQILGIAQRALEFRGEQRRILHGETDCDHSGCSHSVASKKVLGDVTTLNLTVLSTGLPGDSNTKAYNVVPALAEAVFDIRISPHMDPKEMSEKLNLWCRECSATGKSAGESNAELGLRWTYVTNAMQQHQTTSTDPAINPWWTVFENSVVSFGEGAAVTPLVFPAATDSRFLRAIGVRALGFSPIRNSPILLHEHNEYLEESVFLEGCRVYVTLLNQLASQPQFSGDME